MEQKKLDKLLERLSQNLKLIDIKRSVIRTNTRRLPFLYVALGIFGFMLGGAILAISVVFIFVFGALFSGVVANTFGPVGAIERRKDAARQIERLRTEVGEDVYALPDGVAPKVFGFVSATKSDVSLTAGALDLKTMRLDDINGKGEFPFWPYKSIGMVFRDSDGGINLKHPAIKNQYWLIEARLKGTPDAAVREALEKIA